MLSGEEPGNLPPEKGGGVIYGPRANFSCNSPKCRTEDGAAPVYELPVAAKRCAVCGSKRITRLFDAIGVIGLRPMQPEADWRLTSSSPLQRSKALLQDSFDERDRLTAAAKATPSYLVGDQEREVSTAKQGKFIMPARSEVI